MLRRVLFAECSGNAELLTGTKGLFGVNQAHYKNNMRCDWKIQAEPSKVIEFTFTKYILYKSDIYIRLLLKYRNKKIFCANGIRAFHDFIIRYKESTLHDDYKKIQLPEKSNKRNQEIQKTPRERSIRQYPGRVKRILQICT